MGINLDNISNKLEEILRNPEKIQQIMEMASSMGLSGQMSDEIPSGILPQEMIQQVSGLLQQTEMKDKQQQTLIRALLPYLNPRRQARLERAMQLSHISRLAGAAMRNGAGIHLSTQEGEIHV